MVKTVAAKARKAIVKADRKSRATQRRENQNSGR